jgi:hypothetical protein
MKIYKKTIRGVEVYFARIVDRAFWYTTIDGAEYGSHIQDSKLGESSRDSDEEKDTFKTLEDQADRSLAEILK